MFVLFLNGESIGRSSLAWCERYESFLLSNHYARQGEVYVVDGLTGEVVDM